MRSERRGCFYLIMLMILLLALAALLEGYRTLVSLQLERQGDGHEREGQPRWLNPPEKRP
jgi:hypothetical protein